MRDEIFYKDVMNRVLNRREFNRYKNINFEIIEWMEEGVPVHQEILTADDKDLLDKYAPLLFSGIDNVKVVYENMLGLVKSIYCLRYENSIYSIPNDAKNRPPTYKKQSFEFKSDELSKKILKAIPKIEKIIEPIIGIMGGDNYHTSKSCQFKEAYQLLMNYLENASNKSEEYVPYINKEKNNKQFVREYLDGLNLNGKGKVIDLFIKEV